jgi:D-alanyl-D-alanine carboxypeptidase
MTNYINTYHSKVNKLKSAILITSITLALSACGGGSASETIPSIPVPTPTAPTTPIVQPIAMDYQTVINETVSGTIPGVVLLVESPEKKFLGSAGVENSESKNPMQSYHTMPTASAGKPMIGLLAVILADDNLLNLDDTLDTWLSEDILSQIPHSGEMTLRQLLNHTSGIFNYVDNDDYLNLLIAEPDKVKTDIDFLALGLNQPAYFKPGEGTRYSNTGYLLAGLIMDQVLGMHHSIALRERILAPLGMEATYYRGIEKDQGDFISGYHTFDDHDTTYDTKPFLENVSQASSPMASNVEEMAVFLKSAVNDQSFINADIREDFFGAEGVNDDAIFGAKTIDGNTVYAHSGLTYGYHTQNIYIKEKDLSITAFINCSTAPVCESTMDNLIEKVLTNEL